MRKTDFLAIAEDIETLARCAEISAEFGCTYESIPNVETFAEREAEFQDTNFIVISAENAKVGSEIAGMVQVVKQMVPEAYLLVLIDSKLDPSVAVFVKKSGANVVLMASEVRGTSKLEFTSSQKLRSSFLPVIHAKDPITPEKLEKKLKTVGEIYVRREDIEIYQHYTEKFEDQSAAGLSRRRRAQFLLLLKSYVDLILLISDQSEHASFKEGAALYEKCEMLSGQLMTTLGSVGNARDVINNSAIGEFGSIERAPAVAAYAGMLSLHGKIGEPARFRLKRC
jgi:hypothetical protein